MNFAPLSFFSGVRVLNPRTGLFLLPFSQEWSSKNREVFRHSVVEEGNVLLLIFSVVPLLEGL